MACVGDSDEVDLGVDVALGSLGVAKAARGPPTFATAMLGLVTRLGSARTPVGAQPHPRCRETEWWARGVRYHVPKRTWWPGPAGG